MLDELPELMAVQATKDSNMALIAPDIQSHLRGAGHAGQAAGADGCRGVSIARRLCMAHKNGGMMALQAVRLQFRQFSAKPDWVA